MNTEQKLELKKHAMVFGALLVVALAAGGVVKAQQSESLWDMIAKVAGLAIAEKVVVPAMPVEEALGAQATNTNALKEECWGGGDCIVHFGGDFKDATSTLFVIANPFLMVTTTKGDVVIAGPDGAATTSAGNDLVTGFTGATSTIVLTRLNVTGASTVNSNLSYVCATGNSGWGSTSSLSQYLIDTPIAVTGTPYIESGMVSTTYGRSIISGFTDAVSSTPYALTSNRGVVSRVLLTPATPYFSCRVLADTGAGDGLNGVTSTGNTFAGKWTVRVEKQR